MSSPFPRSSSPIHGSGSVPTLPSRTNSNQSSSPYFYTLPASAPTSFALSPTGENIGPASPVISPSPSSMSLDLGESARTFPNGDSYSGQWVSGAPHGKGTYRWSDKSVYEGDWVKGQKHGWGVFVWPSGSRYYGEWNMGDMQGRGSYEGVDKSFYTGNWARGLKHGLGRKHYPNGDTYDGFWSAGAAEGTGRYIWANGNKYIGDWKGGTMSGLGTFTWDCGDVYEGEWEGGFEHGRGLFIWQDGSIYEGTWSHGLKDGKGIFFPASVLKPKVVSGDGDVLASPVPDSEEDTGKGEESIGGDNEGVGIFPEEEEPRAGGMGSVFDAVIAARGAGRRWRSNVASKRVIHSKLVERFVEELDNTQKPFLGRAVTMPAGILAKVRDIDVGQDDSAVAGGKYKSELSPISGHSPEVQLADSDRPRGEARRWDPKERKHFGSFRESSSLGGFGYVTSGTGGGSDKSEEDREETGVSLRPNRREDGALRDVDPSSIKLSQAIFSGIKSPDASEEYVTVREYVHGVLVNETPEGDQIAAIPKRRGFKRENKKAGETIFKGHRSYDLMLTLQLGISYSVGKASQDSDREVTMADFGMQATSTVRFPPEGSQLTPSHNLQMFRWRDYCPAVFRHLRRVFGVDPSLYLASLSGLDALRELSSPGKSGSVFYLSHDDNFIIKTMRKSEVKVLLRMLPAYLSHIQANPNTLVTKFFGLHQVKIHRAHKVRFVVMSNLFKCEVPLHRRYDLKGSSHGRSTNKIEIDETTTLKDLDLDLAFKLHNGLRSTLMTQIASDCQFLQSQKIMDYSLLLGLHFKATEPPPPPVKINEDSIEIQASHKAAVSSVDDSFDNKSEDTDASAIDASSSASYRSFFPWNGWRRTPPPSPARASLSHNSTVVPEPRIELIPSQAVDPQARVLGRHISATALRIDRRDRRPITDPQTAEAYEVVLYFGIIDILQEYDITKKVEHLYKSLQFDSTSISVVDPVLYAERFHQFVELTFPQQ